MIQVTIHESDHLSAIKQLRDSLSLLTQVNTVRRNAKIKACYPLLLFAGISGRKNSRNSIEVRVHASDSIRLFPIVRP